MSPKTKGKHIKKDKGKRGGRQINKTSRYILNRMIEGNNSNDKSSANLKGKGELTDLETLFTQRQDRLWNALEERYQYDTSIKHGQNFLLKHVSSKIPLVIMYADLVGSTKMSMTLPVDKVVTIVRAFSHEMSSVVESHDGYVLKYVGDAVIAFFSSGFNKYLTCDKAVRCAQSMINVVKNGISPILNNYDYPELMVKVGIDEGENVVVQYAYDKSSQIDILGYTMNVAAKITSLTDHNRVSVGENLYKLLHPGIQAEFHELANAADVWEYINRDTGNLYKVYTQS
ncbi:MAG: adenylate/guanylate cyclase domain-containing protein [Nitrososphaeraceae archaeon]